MYVAASATMGGHPRTTVAIIAAGMVGGIIAPLILSPALPYLGSFGFFWVFGAVALAMVAAAVFGRAMLLGPATFAPAA